MWFALGSRESSGGTVRWWISTGGEGGSVHKGINLKTSVYELHNIDIDVSVKLIGLVTPMLVGLVRISSKS